MSKLSLKNRIAFYYIISAALLIFVVFFSIYNIVSATINKNINDQLRKEVNEYKLKVGFQKNILKINDHEEWEKREHNEAFVDPVFLQVTDLKGNIIEKSRNLSTRKLLFKKNIKKEEISNLIVLDKSIRQIQVPLYFNSKIQGYLMVALSTAEENDVLNSLSKILYILFPIVLLTLFFISQFIAGKSIKPINNIIAISETINKNNLSTRLPLPKNKDELFVLSNTINNLLDRIANTIEREKQFTSDASHELRTPLAVIKGTLEVLIRKPRNTEEYQSKINLCISEIDRMNNLVDQLLLLARLENQKLFLRIEKHNINDIINEVINQFSNELQKQQITIIFDCNSPYFINSDKYLLSIILHNLISNAIKYSKIKSSITISIEHIDNKTSIKIEDHGIGIANEEIEKVFNAFYRTNFTSNHTKIGGIGLGLSIAKRLCDVLNIDLKLSSEENLGTTVTLII
ncbi:sensor histidine kinase [Flavobacterium sp.]|uniref:sensor histidine kinase n=1 Tax=Flavobacterium sp. TaxID=239 RepID=UPI0038D25122